MKGSITLTALIAVLFSAGCDQSVSPAAPSPVASSAALPVEVARAPQAASAVSFRGRLDGTSAITPLTPPLASVVISASGQASLLGRFLLSMPHTVNFATRVGIGTFSFAAANGDTVSGTFTGQAQPIGGTTLSIVEQATITGGTGRFADATGAFTIQRVFDQATSITTGSFEGTISAPGATR
jgi:hypothetical protein